ncbi:UNVERIFIED_CONTAM: putative pentatricopeptide repeat-containing protein [Sesamum angustifolium]|uniref:Pentatricopeptide repeat-containing protein n=1 Tax=Sesamum angustifolium TaxID=2727405 RepID=A0AAW2PQP7_9LAMI
MLFPLVLEHSSSAILTLLRACKTIRDLNQVHSHIIRRGCEQDHFLIAQFISICATVLPTNVSYSTSVFNCVTCPNIYLWNILMKAHCENYSLYECFSLFNRMRNAVNVVPDKYTFPSLIKACSNYLALREGKIVHGVTVRNEVSWTAMMVGHLNIGDIDAARCLFDEMPKRNEATWNAMIKGLVKLGDLKSARKVFDVMPSRNEVSFTTLIDGYAKAGDMVAARSLFDELPQKDVVSWSALMSGYVENGKPVGSLELAKWIESYMKNESFDLRRAHVAAALVDMNAKCGNMERATILFREMPKRDLISYCSMIQGLCIHSRGPQAVLLFDRMIDEGIRPDDVAFTVILTACSHAGLEDDGCRLFDLMIHNYSISPSPDHYACMVNLLGKSGKVQAAYELIQSTPVETHAGAWGALLGACRLHGDMDLGEVVAHRLFELEPHNAGNYVLLSNIYAEADRWLNVFHLRDRMSERGVRKIPGCSLCRVNYHNLIPTFSGRSQYTHFRRVHRFHVGPTLLEKLRARIGYADTTVHFSDNRSHMANSNQRPHRGEKGRKVELGAV